MLRMQVALEHLPVDELQVRQVAVARVADIVAVGDIDLIEVVQGLRLAIIDDNRQYLTDDFLQARMKQSLAVDETLGKIIRS